jgi:hypothetical protein
MMEYFYSESKKSFYNHEINGDNIPSDAISMTEEYHSFLLNGQSAGKVISVVDGIVVLTDPLPPLPEQNELIASDLLYGTDWTTIPDVANPINDPYLGNQAEFIAYRNKIRKIAVNPPAGDIVWAVQPTPVWVYK